MIQVELTADVNYVWIFLSKDLLLNRCKCIAGGNYAVTIFFVITELTLASFRVKLAVGQ